MFVYCVISMDVGIQGCIDLILFQSTLSKSETVFFCVCTQYQGFLVLKIQSAVFWVTTPQLSTWLTA
jgi:hypothetical protein